MTVYYEKLRKGWASHFQYQNVSYKSKIFRTKREAVAWEKAKKRELEGKTLTLSGLVEKRLDDYTLRDQRATRAKVEQMYRCRVSPYMPDKDIDSYSIEDINDLVIRLKKKLPIQEGFTPREQSNYSINYVVNRLGSVFNWGIRNGLCSNNPCKNFQMLKYTPKEKVYWTEDEFNQVIASLKPEQYKLKARLEVFFWTGMRKSEGRALQWEDFDEARGTLTIRKHIVEDGGHHVVPGRKNGGAPMIVGLSDETIATLRRTKELDRKYHDFSEKWYILGEKKPFVLSAFAEQLDAVAKKVGVPRITPHGLRHSHVSWMYSNTDLTIQEVAERIGDKVQTVENVYAHLYKDNSRKIVSTINRRRKSE